MWLGTISHVFLEVFRLRRAVVPLISASADPVCIVRQVPDVEELPRGEPGVQRADHLPVPPDGFALDALALPRTPEDPFQLVMLPAIP